MSMLIGIIAFLAGTLIGAIIMALAFVATRSAEKEEELMNYIERGEHDGNKTCATCTENDGGLCDLKGLLAEDDDTCERWSNKQADWREHMLHTFLAGH